MTVTATGAGTIRLDGVCPIEDAEPLLQLILSSPGMTIDWRGCEHAHAAVIQILLAARPVLHGPPASAFLRNHIDPLLNGEKGGASLAQASVPNRA
jgi:hypothetical protein